MKADYAPQFRMRWFRKDETMAEDLRPYDRPSLLERRLDAVLVLAGRIVAVPLLFLVAAIALRLIWESLA